MGSTLSLILPCYNESESISSVIDELVFEKDQLIKSGRLKDLEIIVVDDGSTDNGLEILKTYGNLIKIIALKKNLGYGQALKVGFKESKGDILGFYDLDCTCSAKDLNPLLTKMEKDSSGLVLGIRISPNSKMPLIRNLGNRIYRSITSLFLGVELSDCCTGYRLFKRSYLNLFLDPLPDQLNYSLAMTIAFIRSGGKLSQQNIHYGSRSGRSKLIPIIDGPRFLWTLIKYCVGPRFSPSRLKPYLAP